MTSEELPWEVTLPGEAGQSLVSRRAFAVGETVAAFGASRMVDRPAQMTLQVDEATYILLTPPSLSFMNHGCTPNMHVDVARRLVIALRSIRVKDPLEYFYPSTEWAMASPFDCACGRPECFGRIAGASEIPGEKLVGRPLAPHIARLLAARRASGSEAQ